MLFALAVVVVAAALRSIELILVPASVPRILWLVPTFAFMLWLYRRSGKWTGGRGFRQNVRKDLEAGKVRVLKLTVASALEFEAVGDSGPTFVVTTDTGEQILFAGQMFARYKSKGFPWNEFEVCEAPNSKVFFGVFGHGQAFRGIERRPALTYEQAKALGSFQKSWVALPAGWERVLHQASPQMADDIPR